jgi:hypothetical protein
MIKNCIDCGKEIEGKNRKRCEECNSKKYPHLYHSQIKKPSITSSNEIIKKDRADRVSIATLVSAGKIALIDMEIDSISVTREGLKVSVEKIGKNFEERF